MSHDRSSLVQGEVHFLLDSLPSSTAFSSKILLKFPIREARHQRHVYKPILFELPYAPCTAITAQDPDFSIGHSSKSIRSNLISSRMSSLATTTPLDLGTSTLLPFSSLKPATTDVVSVKTEGLDGEYSVVDPPARTEWASLGDYGVSMTIGEYSNSLPSSLVPDSYDQSKGTPFTPIIVPIPIAQHTSSNPANAVGKRYQQPDRLEAAPGAPTVDGEGQDTVNKDEPVQHGEGVEEGDKLKTVDRTGAQLVAAIAVVGFAHLLL